MTISCRLRFQLLRIIYKLHHGCLPFPHLRISILPKIAPNPATGERTYRFAESLVHDPSAACLPATLHYADSDPSSNEIAICICMQMSSMQMSSMQMSSMQMSTAPKRPRTKMRSWTPWWASLSPPLIWPSRLPPPCFPFPSLLTSHFVGDSGEFRPRYRVYIRGRFPSIYAVVP